MSLLLLLAAAVSPPMDYTQPANWLCRPGREAACAGESVTVLDPAGHTRVVEPAPARSPQADCFYVYPTVSFDKTPNSDMIAGPEERGTVAVQLAPFGGVCRLFAPMYRQATRAALAQRMAGGSDPADHALAYADVRAAWHDYLAHDNGGRPVVLIGHSQGSMILKRLIAEEIDGKPVQRLLLSAILPGTTILVPPGRDVGGEFATIPLCRAADQTGCLVTWASYRDGPGPPADALFGRTGSPTVATSARALQPGLVAACTNPAGLAGGDAPLDPELGFPRYKGGFVNYGAPATGWSVDGVPLKTRFVAVRGLLSGRCVTRGAMSYLSVHVVPGIAPDLAEGLVGTATIGDDAYPDWGWHVIDMAIVEGDLVRLVARQSAAWKGQR
jgi:pimeloyl-ACP methyl ester carboxylesterase